MKVYLGVRIDWSNKFLLVSTARERLREDESIPLDVERWPEQEKAFQSSVIWMKISRFIAMLLHSRRHSVGFPRSSASFDSEIQISKFIRVLGERVSGVSESWAAATSKEMMIKSICVCLEYMSSSLTGSTYIFHTLSSLSISLCNNFTHPLSSSDMMCPDTYMRGWSVT